LELLDSPGYTFEFPGFGSFGCDLLGVHGCLLSKKNDATSEGSAEVRLVVAPGRVTTVFLLVFRRAIYTVCTVSSRIEGLEFVISECVQQFRGFSLICGADGMP